MDIYTTVFIAIGLAMDAFAVSITSGLAIRQLKVNHALKIAAFFGFFQAIMPVIGWAAGIGLKDFIAAIDHWIAFGILSIVGAKMILESMAMKPADKKIPDLNIYMLLMLSIATSIDALAVGLSLSLLNISIITPAVVIGIVTFLFSFTGVYVGDRFGHFFESKIEALGGLILIGIGVKILIEHLS